MQNSEPIKEISLLLDLELSPKEDEALLNLQERINHLLINDFEKLISILYRIDVNEEKLRTVLKNQAGENAAKLIAQLMIERQIEKIESRKRFGGGASSWE